MGLPICEDCSKRTLLCPKCQLAYDRAKITSLEVEVSRQIAAHVRGNIDVKGAVRTRDQVIIIAAKEHVGRIIGESGASIARISESLGAKTKVIGASDYESIAKALIAPARVRSINRVFGPLGDSIRIRVEKEDIPNMRLPSDALAKVISAACSEDVRISPD